MKIKKPLENVSFTNKSNNEKRTNKKLRNKKKIKQQTENFETLNHC